VFFGVFFPPFPEEEISDYIAHGPFIRVFTVVLPGIFCPFKRTILVTSTLVHLLEYITVTIITTAIIAPVTIVIISLDFCFVMCMTSLI